MGLGSEIWDPRSRVKKAPDPGSRSVTLSPYRRYSCTGTSVLSKPCFALGGGIYCNRHNPREREYFTNFIANGLDLIQVDESLRNNGSDSLHNYIARAYNAGLIRRLNMGLFSGETKKYRIYSFFSLWTRNLFCICSYQFVDPGPHWFHSGLPGFESRSKEIDQNYQISLIPILSKKFLFRRRYDL
jgi:hypothetical protein